MVLMWCLRRKCSHYMRGGYASVILHEQSRTPVMGKETSSQGLHVTFAGIFRLFGLWITVHDDKFTPP
jgi:hypothetical protein